MQKTCFLLLSAILLFSCGDPQRGAAVKPSESNKNQKTKSKLLPLSFAEPVQIDSSAYVMLPLAIKIGEDEDEYSYSKRNVAAYWNIVFYNTVNKQYHLLDSTKRMVIESYDIEDNSESADADIVKLSKTVRGDNHIFYLVKTLDFNKDNYLGDDDPRYLFMSDKTGNHFKQISPDNLDVLNWTLIRKTNKILIRTAIPGKDNEKGTTLYIYDLTTDGTAQKTFSDDFVHNAQALFDQHWQVKK